MVKHHGAHFCGSASRARRELDVASGILRVDCDNAGQHLVGGWCDQQVLRVAAIELPRAV